MMVRTVATRASGNLDFLDAKMGCGIRWTFRATHSRGAPIWCVLREKPLISIMMVI